MTTPVHAAFASLEKLIAIAERAVAEQRRAVAALRKIRDTERRPDLGPADVLRIVGETVEAFFAQVPK